MFFRDRLNPDRFFGKEKEEITIPKEKRQKLEKKDFFALVIAAFSSFMPVVLGVWAIFALVILLVSLLFR